MSKNEQIDVRSGKLEALRELGVNPYPSAFDGRIEILRALSMDEGGRARISGRMMSRRVMGKAAFAHLKDSSGKMQIYVRKDKLGQEHFDVFNELDIGDHIGVEGDVFTTRTGEKTVMAESVEVLSKSLRPLPEKWHGLRDTELRYRKRYLDILVNPESAAVLKARSAIIGSIRTLLEARGYIEVETPVLQDIPGGAAARPFITHHNVYHSDLYLRIAPELYLKRLLVGGWDRVFEIGRNFRNEGVSTRHNPEFTMLEAYCSYTDYRYMMRLSREIVLSAMDKLEGRFSSEIDITKGWEEKDLWQLISGHTGIEFLPDDPFSVLKEKASRLNVPPGKDSPAKLVDRIFTAYVQDKLVEPTFVTGYLAQDSPLAKVSSSEKLFAERFELYIGGQEIGNAYSEQNDPAVQRKMFEVQVSGDDDDETVKKIDTDYLESMEYGMPPASGLGIGLDRLVMLLTGSESIREVILFPMLKSSD